MKARIRAWKNTNLNGNGGIGADTIVRNEDVIRQNDNFVLDFLADALGPACRHSQPYGFSLL